MTTGLLETIEAVQRETKPLGWLSAEFQLQRIRRLCIGVTGAIEPLTPSSKDRQIEEMAQYITELEHERNRNRHELVRLRAIAAYVEGDE